MKHSAASSFWENYNSLPTSTRSLADKNFRILKETPRHPSLRLKKINNFWSVRVGLNHRAVGISNPEKEGIIWIWIGNHDAGDVLDICDRLNVTVGPITSMKDIDEDPHYNERGSIIEMEDPVTGTNLKIPTLSFRMTGTPGKIRFPGLPHGSANKVIYRDLLKYSPEEIEWLKEVNAI